MAKGIKISKEALAGKSTGGGKKIGPQREVEIINREKIPHDKLPEIKHPSLHPHEKPTTNYLDEIALQKFNK